MIAFIHGVVHRVRAGAVDVDVHGIGYRVFVTETWAATLSPGEELIIHTHQHVREDEISLYGFPSESDLDWFELLISISGIGPKGALGVMSGTDYPTFCRSILSEDYALLTKMPGIGKKTAQRLVVELKDKLQNQWQPSSASQPTKLSVPDRPPTVERDVIEALLALGYNERQVADVVRQATADRDGGTVEEILRLCLQGLARG